MKIKTSWNRIHTAVACAERYLREHPEKTKLEYAIARSLPRLAKLNEALQEQLDAVNIEHAAVDANGVLIIQNGAYQFKPEEKKKANIARRKLLNDETVEIEPYFASTVPDDLDELYLDGFEGIIVKTEDVERIRAQREALLDTPNDEQHAVQ